MVIRDIYVTGFEEEVRAELSTSQRPECDERVTTNAIENDL